jgi:branched-chain amino acid transport system permease protein
LASLEGGVYKYKQIRLRLLCCADEGRSKRPGSRLTEFGQSLIYVLALGSLHALIALGVAVIYAVMGLMNFVQGEFIMVPAYALYVLTGIPFAVAVGGALLTGVGLAVLAERVAFLPVWNADLSAQLITSLAAAAILQNVVSVAVDARAQSVATPAFLSESTPVGTISMPNLELVTIGLTALALAGLGWLSTGPRSAWQ